MRLYYLIFIFIFFSCKRKKQVTIPTEKKLIIDSNTASKSHNNNFKIKDCPIDSLDMQTSEFKTTKFYTENTMRGKGVIEMSIKEKLTILNPDKTIFGSIIFKEDSYDINLPSKIIAREIIPDSEFQTFSFDSELPDTEKEYLIVYIDKEKKLLLKKEQDYIFLKWDDYIKSSFIQLTPDVDNVNKEAKYMTKIVRY